MGLSEGYGYVMGNLTRDWETKDVKVKGDDKRLHTAGLAYQPNKDDEVEWVDLTIWPDPQGSTKDAEAVASETGKGTKVIVRGVLKLEEYKSKEGEDKSSWRMSAWQVARVVRAPFEGGGQHKAGGDRQVVEYDDEEPF